MAAPSLVIHQPICNLLTFYSKFRDHNFPRNSLPCLRFLNSARCLAGGFLHRNRVRVSDPKIMSELIRTCAYRNGSDGDERLQPFEQEAFIDDGSSEFRPDLTSGGLEASLNRLSKWLIATLFGAVVISRHDAEALWAVVGSVANSMLSVALKWILNEERPFPSQKSDPGMPSSHAQSIAYIAVFAILSTVEWLGINELSVSISGLMLVWASYFSWLRVSQKLHTISQVAVGAIIGATFSMLWYVAWKAIVFEAFLSSLWVQITVVLGAAALSLGFLVYVFRYWFQDAR